MVRSMSPSAPLTSEQIAKFADLPEADLAQSGLPPSPTQRVLESQGAALADELVAAVCKRRVEAISNVIVRSVTVNRDRTPKEALAATGRRQDVDDAVVAAMPRGAGKEVEIEFFNPDLSKRGGRISDDDLEKEFESCGYRPADPYELAAVNEADPAFADDHPNGTHWKNAADQWCFEAFDRWLGERRVSVYRSDGDWLVSWWFARVRK